MKPGDQVLYDLPIHGKTVTVQAVVSTMVGRRIVISFIHPRTLLRTKRVIVNKPERSRLKEMGYDYVCIFVFCAVDSTFCRYL